MCSSSWYQLAEDGGHAPQRRGAAPSLSKRGRPLGRCILQTETGGRRRSCSGSAERARAGFQPGTAPRRLCLPKKWTPRRDSRPDPEVRSLVWYKFHHAEKNGALARIRTGTIASLGSRMTSICRRAHGPRGRTCTFMEPLRRRRPICSSHAEKNGAPIRMCAGLLALRVRCVAVYASGAGKWSSHQDSHLDFELRTLASFCWTMRRRRGADGGTCTPKAHPF